MAGEDCFPLLRFRLATCAIQGMRVRQEDYCLTWTPGATTSCEPSERALAIVADGMGGHVSGQVASRLACESFLKSFLNETKEIGPRLAYALQDSNASLAASVAQDPSLNGMGCTLVACHVDADGLRWVSVGDSSLLLYRDGVLHRLNADHSHGALLDKQAAAGLISEQEAQSSKQRRALYSALTGATIPEQDLSLKALPLKPGDWVFVASDGLLSASGDALAQLIYEQKSMPPDLVAKRLLQLVEDQHNPKQDNATIIAIAVLDDDTPEPLCPPTEVVREPSSL